MSLSMVTTASLPGTFLSGHVPGSDQRFALAVEVFCCAWRTAYPPRPKNPGASKERNKRKRFRIVKPNRSCYTASRADRRPCSKGQFYTYRRPDKIPGFNAVARVCACRAAGVHGGTNDLCVEELSAGGSS